MSNEPNMTKLEEQLQSIIDFNDATRFAHLMTKSGLSAPNVATPENFKVGQNIIQANFHKVLVAHENAMVRLTFRPETNRSDMIMPIWDFFSVQAAKDRERAIKQGNLTQHLLFQDLLSVFVHSAP